MSLTLTSSSRRHARLNWRRNLLIACIAITEVLWIAPLLQWFLILLDDPFPMSLSSWIGLVGGNVIAALTLRRVMNARRWTNQQQIPYTLAGFVICLLISVAMLPVLQDVANSPDFDFGAAFDVTGEVIPNGIILAPIILILFGRGSAIGGSQLTYVGVGILVRLGILMLFLNGVLSSLPIEGNIEALADDLITVLPPFFCASLIASALSRSASLKIEDELRQKRFGLPWLGFLITLAVSLTVIGGLLSLLLGDVDRDQALKIIGLPFVIIITVIFILASPFLYIGDILINWMRNNFSNEAPRQEVIGGGEQPIREDRGLPQIDIGDELRAIYHFFTQGVGLAIIIFLIVVVVGFWLLAFLTREGGGEADEESESIDRREKAGGLRRAIANQLRKLTDTLGLVRQFGLGSDLFAVFTIRWAYSRMERMAKKRGFGRTRSQTPYEYRFSLYKAFPGGEADIRTITDAYVAIRYGELPEDNQAVDNVRKALDRLKEMPEPA